MACEFIYFDFVGGRGSACRIALKEAGLLNDNRVKFPDYQAMKGEKGPEYQNGLPVCIIDGEAYTQSGAIMRYAGKKSGLYPADDFEALKVDEIVDIAADILVKCPQDPDEEVKKKKRQEYAEGKMKSLFNLVAKRIQLNGSGWTAGPKLTIADLALYFVVQMIRSGNFDHVASDYCDQWPELAEYEKKCLADPLFIQNI
jgi:glutathione S-transferase